MLRQIFWTMYSDMNIVLMFAAVLVLVLAVSAYFGLFWPVLFTIVVLALIVYFALGATPSPYPHEGSDKTGE